jgi:hypothetical protein
MIILIFISSCKKETIIPASPSFNYFPVEPGRWVEYDVDSVYHAENDNNNDDSVYSFHFQIREEIDSTFINGQGQEAQILIRYKRNSSNEDWVLSNVWTQTLSLTGAYRIEENVPYHKLAFPINSSTVWDGNDANTEEEEIYSYDSFHQEAIIGGLVFDSTLSVLQIEEDNFIERIYGKEIYAVGIGMIFKQRDDLGKRNGIVVKGLEYKMTVRDYGPR